jgi:hypothetical protein
VAHLSNSDSNAALAELGIADVAPNGAFEQVVMRVGEAVSNISDLLTDTAPDRRGSIDNVTRPMSKGSDGSGGPRAPLVPVEEVAPGGSPPDTASSSARDQMRSRGRGGHGLHLAA